VKSTKTIIPLDTLLASSKILIEKEYSNDINPETGELAVKLTVNGRTTYIPVEKHFDIDEVLVGTLKDCKIPVSILGEEDPIEIYGH